MQRATATAGRWMGAFGAGLALPFFSILAHAGPTAAARAGEIAAVASERDLASATVPARWRNYALASITPQFSWALQPQRLAPPDVLDNYSGDLARAPLFQARASASSHLEVSIATGTIADTPGVLPEPSARLFGLPNPGLQRTVVAPALTAAWGEHGSVRLTGVLAYQRFASLGLGTQADVSRPLPTWLADNSYGAGARVDVGSVLGQGLNWKLSYQSRVNMAAFANYRGVFADQGDFDIPASASASLSYALTPTLAIDAGAQHVQYSAIRPFTSSNLPIRFLALLGDSSSPVFAWRDLNVYSLGWTLSEDRIGTIQMRYTTRQQPVPTSRLLENALASATANDMFSLAWSRDFGSRTNLSFSASYATSPYFLLMPTYVPRSDATASRFEFEALWSARF